VRFIDLHTHVLPGFDDGAADLDAAIAMLEIAAADHTATVVATPHARHDLFPGVDRASSERLLELVRERAPQGLTLGLGAEVRVDSELLGELDRGEDVRWMYLAGSRYILLELPPVNLGLDPVGLVHELHVAGSVPIIAHPERISWLQEDQDALAALTDRGGLLQITAGALTGAMGRAPGRCAHWLMDQRLVSFVASDAHNTTTRPPRLHETFTWVGDRWGADTAQRLFVENPARVLADQPIHEPEGETS
jgi:protein-tyrosine phosphatase